VDVERDDPGVNESIAHEGPRFLRTAGGGHLPYVLGMCVVIIPVLLM
jgi:hypothetical protein